VWKLRREWVSRIYGRRELEWEIAQLKGRAADFEMIGVTDPDDEVDQRNHSSMLGRVRSGP
jgi:hypothetical protein